MGRPPALVIALFMCGLGVGSYLGGALYAVDTAGAALGCFLTDQLLVPSVGLLATQLLAVLLNLVAALVPQLDLYMEALGRR